MPSEGPMGITSIDLPVERLWEFCTKWKVKELSLFGSVLRADFRPESAEPLYVAG